MDSLLRKPYFYITVLPHIRKENETSMTLGALKAQPNLESNHRSKKKLPEGSLLYVKIKTVAYTWFISLAARALLGAAPTCLSTI
jgi:hypothetical protein